MVTALGVLSCDPAAPLRVENQSDQTLSIFVKHETGTYRIGNVAPGTEIENENPLILRFSVFPIEAINERGDVVYSRVFALEELRDYMDWKVVIPPLQNE
jgi:hypothetical protein